MNFDKGCITNSGVAPNENWCSYAADFSDGMLCEDRNQGTHQIFEFHSLNLSKDKTFCVLSTLKNGILPNITAFPQVIKIPTIIF